MPTPAAATPNSALQKLSCEHLKPSVRVYVAVFTSSFSLIMFLARGF
jgi:hypothetical protein|tara:strand:- start:268 stop:408 length:141 start_codon:yes stop_codon:yes gene_type:complete